MTTQLADALRAAGLVEKYQYEKPKGTFHYQFYLPVTRFEVPIFIKVVCEAQEQGVKFISNRKLNDIPQDITLDQAKELIRTKLDEWFLEPVSENENGTLRYWKWV